jgi:hypothetical protein
MASFTFFHDNGTDSVVIGARDFYDALAKFASARGIIIDANKAAEGKAAKNFRAEENATGAWSCGSKKVKIFFTVYTPTKQTDHERYDGPHYDGRRFVGHSVR